MQTGSKEHKASFIEQVHKTYQENIWKEEYKILEFELLLGSLRTQLADTELKIERKEFKTAGEGRKAKERIEADIESTQAAIERKNADKESWVKQIEVLKQYAERN